MKVSAFVQAVRLSGDLGLDFSNGQVERLSDHLARSAPGEAQRLAGVGAHAIRALLPADSLDRAIDRLRR